MDGMIDITSDLKMKIFVKKEMSFSSFLASQLDFKE